MAAPSPIPAAPTLSPGHLVLHAKQLEIDAVRELAARAELVEGVGQLIHALQRERGASSTFLASQGRRLAEVREAAIVESLPAAGRVRALFERLLGGPQGGGATPRMASLMAWVLLGLDALEALRGQVAQRALTAHAAVAAYSRLIAGPVELIVHVADASLLPHVSRGLVALLHLVQGKEAAGQERALGALLFASGQCSPAHQQRLVHLVDAQERSLQVFCDFADPAWRARWEHQQLAPGTALLERMRRTVCTARAGGLLDSELSEAWFEVSSERINTLWALELEVVRQVRADCEAAVHQAEQDLQDAAGLLRRLRDQPPAHAHAVERFFDIALPVQTAPALAASGAAGESASVVELLQAQSARLAAMETELEAARRALDERKVIERAKGVLMARLGLTEEAAFRALQKTSMDQNRRLREVAEATLALPDFAFAQIGAAPPHRTASAVRGAAPRACAAGKRGL